MPAESTTARPRGGWRGRTTAAAAGLVLVTSLGTLGFSRAVGAGVETDHITTLVIGTMPVETRGGTPGMERLLTWAFDQFSGRGLPTPPVSSVTFRNRDSCTGVTGWFSGGAVTVCFVEQEACADAECSRWRPWVKRTVVHELAHAWMSEWLPAHRIEAFMADVDLPTWASDSWPWEERGVELAAETLAWASQDWPARVNARLGNPSCEELTSYYRTLTGRPLNPAPDCTGPDLGSQDPGSPSRSVGTRTPTDSDTTECRIPITPNRTRTRSEPRAATAMPSARSCPTDAPRSVREAERGQGTTRCGIAALGRSAHPSATPTSPTEGVATVRNARIGASACIALMSLIPALPVAAATSPESMRPPFGWRPTLAHSSPNPPVPAQVAASR